MYTYIYMMYICVDIYVYTSHLIALAIKDATLHGVTAASSGTHTHTLVGRAGV